MRWPPPRLALALSLATGLRIGAIALTREADLHLDPEPMRARATPGRGSGCRRRTASSSPRRSGGRAPISTCPFAACGGPVAGGAGAAARGRGGYAFPAAPAADGPNTVSKAWTDLAKAGAVPADTRRTTCGARCARMLGEIDHGGAFEDEERLIGHAVGQRGCADLDRGRRLARLRPIADAWGARLAAIAGGSPAQVAALPAGRRA